MHNKIYRRRIRTKIVFEFFIIFSYDLNKKYVLRRKGIITLRNLLITRILLQLLFKPRYVEDKVNRAKKEGRR